MGELAGVMGAEEAAVGSHTSSAVRQCAEAVRTPEAFLFCVFRGFGVVRGAAGWALAASPFDQTAQRRSPGGRALRPRCGVQQGYLPPT